MHEFLLKLPFAKRINAWMLRPRGLSIYGHIQGFLGTHKKILDVGTGAGDVAHAMQQAGNIVTALDVKNYSCTPEIQPVLYDGKVMPFPGRSFDVATIIMTLHHTPDPERIIQEAARVAQKLVIIEDVFTSTPHKYATFFVDNLMNLEFFGNPHTNKTDEQWKATFKKHGLRLTDEAAFSSLLVMRHKIYVLETSKNKPHKE